MSDTSPIIDVNEQGLDVDGFDYVRSTSVEALKGGLVAERVVRLRYPDGSLRDAIEVLITKKGFALMGASLAGGS